MVPPLKPLTNVPLRRCPASAKIRRNSRSWIYTQSDIRAVGSGK